MIGAGTECTITERSIDAWATVSESSVSLTVTTGENDPVVFENELQLGSTIGVAAPVIQDPIGPTTSSDATAVARVESSDLPDGPLALTGSSARDLAAVALTMLGMGFFVAGTGRRRRNSF